MAGATETGIIHDSSFFKLLMSNERRYRIIRHSLFVLALSIMAINQVYMGFLEYRDMLGGQLYFFMFVMLLTYLLQGYFNVYVLIPGFFLREKYLWYFIIFSIVVFLSVMLHFSLEYLLFKMHDVTPGLYSYFSTGSPFWLEIAQAYLINYVAVLGAGVTVMFKCWHVNDRKVYELEKVHMQTEVDKMKEQVSPRFLFSVLHKIADSVSESQEKASDMLMDLSDILRYQLYDCSRESVLLSAEIQFVTTYLQIEKSYYGKMDFDVITSGEVRHVIVAPLLFLPLVQSAVRSFNRDGAYFNLRLTFDVVGGVVLFRCDCNGDDLLSSPDLIKFRQRLQRLYAGKHVLSVGQTEASDGYSVCLHIKQ